MLSFRTMWKCTCQSTRRTDGRMELTTTTREMWWQSTLWIWRCLDVHSCHRTPRISCASCSSLWSRRSAPSSKSWSTRTPTGSRSRTTTQSDWFKTRLFTMHTWRTSSTTSPFSSTSLLTNTQLTSTPNCLRRRTCSKKRRNGYSLQISISISVKNTATPD